jgi:hypothetical protein
LIIFESKTLTKSVKLVDEGVVVLVLKVTGSKDADAMYPKDVISRFQ